MKSLRLLFRVSGWVFILAAFSTLPLCAQTAASPTRTKGGKNTVGEKGTAPAPRVVPGLDLTLMPILAGDFMMGSLPGEPSRTGGEGPQAKVTITHAFWLGKYTVTQGQWQALMGTVCAELRQRTLDSSGPHLTPESKAGFEMLSVANIGIDYPMIYVNWDDALAFCRKLNEVERKAGRMPAGYEYRMPTEAEWEYACRAGTTEATYAGPVIVESHANDDPFTRLATDPVAAAMNAAMLGKATHLKVKIEGSRWNRPKSDIAWSEGNTAEIWYVNATDPGLSYGYWIPDDVPKEVGGKLPNAWGLYDMLGNVNQWCFDWYDWEYGHSGPPGGTDPHGPKKGYGRAIRGGYWGTAYVRAAARAWASPDSRGNTTGFRVALAPIVK